MLQQALSGAIQAREAQWQQALEAQRQAEARRTQALQAALAEARRQAAAREEAQRQEFDRQKEFDAALQDAFDRGQGTARKDLDGRIRELEEELRRLQGAAAEAKAKASAGDAALAPGGKSFGQSGKAGDPTKASPKKPGDSTPAPSIEKADPPAPKEKDPVASKTKDPVLGLNEVPGEKLWTKHTGQGEVVTDRMGNRVGVLRFGKVGLDAEQPKNPYRYQLGGAFGREAAPEGLRPFLTDDVVLFELFLLGTDTRAGWLFRKK